MARRKIGRAWVYLKALDEETDDKRWIYEVRIVVDRRLCWSGRVMSQPGGTRVDGKLVALDSREAFDAIARTAVNFGSSYDEDDKGMTEESAEEIACAVQEAAIPDDDRYHISARG